MENYCYYNEITTTSCFEKKWVDLAALKAECIRSYGIFGSVSRQCPNEDDIILQSHFKQ